MTESNGATASSGSPSATVLISENLYQRLPGLAEEFPTVTFVQLPMEDGTMRPEYLTADAMFRSAMDETLFDAIVRDAPRLRWIQISAAGFDWMGGDALPDRVAAGLVLTRCEGSLNVTIAEYTIAAMIGLARGLPGYHLAQGRREWVRLPGRDFIGSTVMVFGTGAIGSEVAWRAAALGTRVIGVNRKGTPAEHFHEVIDRHSFRERLAEADFVVLAMPHTPETERMFGAAEFAAMKPSAFLVNVGRGILTDEAALVDALESETIAGAYVDVFVEEPLPADSPMWTTKNLVATPHVSYRSDGNDARLRHDFCSNLRRFLAGERLSGTMKEPALGY